MQLLHPGLPMTEDIYNVGGAEQVVCTICRNDNAQPFPWGDYHLNLLPPFHVVRCQGCGLLYLSPRPDSTTRHRLMQGSVPDILLPYSMKTANYASVTRSREPLFRKRLRQMLALSNHKDFSTSQPILDVGASSGTFTLLARQQGWHAFGVEPDETSVKTAHKQGITFPQGVAEHLPYPNETFALVHSHHVFEHLANPFQATQEAWRVLKPGGFLFIEVPNQFDNIMFHRDILFRRVPQRERNIRSIHHLWFFSPQTLKRLIQEAGFSNVSVKSIYGAKAKGWRLPFSLMTRLGGRFWYGGPVIQGYGWKEK